MVPVSDLESFLLLWRLSVNTTVHRIPNKDSHPSFSKAHGLAGTRSRA